MSKPKLPQGRPLPPEYEFKATMRFFREFTWKERLQILFNYRARINIILLMRHSPGAMQPIMKLDTTKDLEPALKETTLS